MEENLEKLQSDIAATQQIVRKLRAGVAGMDRIYEPRAREYSDNYRKMLDIIEGMIIFNMKLLKEKACL